MSATRDASAPPPGTLASLTVRARVCRDVTLRALLAPPLAEVPPPWPLLLFLHGSGERGDDAARLTRYGPPALAAAGTPWPALTVAPQCPADDRWTDHLDALLALLDEVAARHPVDASRVVVSGVSLGGEGCYELLARAPERFAAALVICGPGRPERAARHASVPTWVVHGEDDEVVPPDASRAMVAALRGAGGHARLTTYPGVGHEAWTRAYADPTLRAWLLGAPGGAA